MKRSYKTLAVAVTTLALTTTNSSIVSACGGRSGGGGGSFARVSFGGGHSSYPSHNRYGGHYGGTSTYAPSCPTSRYAAPVYSQPAPSQPFPSQSIPPQPQQSFQPAAAPTGAPSNLAANGASQGRPSQPTPTQPAGSAATAPAAAPAQSTSPRSQPASQPQSAEASALQMLASINNADSSPAEETQSLVPEFTAAAATTGGDHVGSWKVNLPGNQSVELILEADGKFSWTATKDGKSNAFSGQYRLEDGQLTLVRSSDLQQMSGQWTGSEGNFTFKLDGATNGGLNFQRS
ncbi:hypothetical protein [Novipirellula caenicola]|uniref:Uncharacterized protein n=1 Tax=Novipirellula caenicola TaxID=1536901 RepID=A0ABP9VSP6_9BACT